MTELLAGSKRMKERWYAETSAINYLASMGEEHDALATRNLQGSKGREWLMSPVTFFELSLTKNEGDRDRLIGYAKHLLSPIMAPSPEEIVMNFIRNGFPLFDEQVRFESHLPLAKCWSRIAGITDLMYSLRQDQIQDHAKLMRIFGDVASEVLLEKGIVGDPVVVKYQEIVGLIRLRLGGLAEMYRVEGGIDRCLSRIVIYFVYTQLCEQITPYPHVYDGFWRRVGIVDPIERMRWLIGKWPVLFFRGPFIEMGIAAIAQIYSKSSRGMIFDILHFVYLTYVKRFLSTDPHFLRVGEFYEHPNMHKIVLLEEGMITRTNFRADYPLRRVVE